MSNPPPRISFSHFGVNCFDIDKMEAFYTNVIGMVVTDRGFVEPINTHLCFLTLDPNEHHQLVLSSGRTEGEPRSDAFLGGAAGSAINQISFRLADLDELRNLRARLATVGVTNGTPTNHGTAWAMYVRDIEGNPMEFFIDSPWYVPQPFGSRLDLSKPNDQIYAETEALCRKIEGFEPIESWRIRIARQLEAKSSA
jgi:catechol-2,3-dioxygenase